MYKLKSTIQQSEFKIITRHCQKLSKAATNGQNREFKYISFKNFQFLKWMLFVAKHKKIMYY